MTKIEHLQFLLLMIPTFLLLCAAAVSMADLALPAEQAPVVLAGPLTPMSDATGEDRPAQ